VAACIVIAFAMIRLIAEVFQMFTLGYFYLKDWINIVEVTLFTLSIIFCFVFTEKCLCPTSWQWQVGCIAVFLAWIDFIIFFRKFPLAGEYSKYLCMHLNIMSKYVQKTHFLPQEIRLGLRMPGIN